jgi:hypothetical protein
LVAGYAGYDYWSSQRQDQKTAAQKILLDAPVEQVRKITLQLGGPEIQLEKTEKGWKMTQPVADEANGTLIDQFLDGISTEKSQDTVAEGEKVDFAAFGLDQPKGVIELTLNSGKSIRYAIGRMKNYQGDAYLRKDNENKVLIVSSTWFSKVDKTALDFRDKRLMRRSNAKTDRISIETETEKFQLIKKDGNWMTEAHPDWKLDQNKIREFLSQLNSTEALEFIVEGDATAAEMKKWGLSSPALRVKVEATTEKESKPWVAEFATFDKVSRVHVSDPNRVLKISPPDFNKFVLLNLDSFRDRTEPFMFDHGKVRKIELKLGNKIFNLKSDDPKAKDLMNQFDKIKVADFGTPKSLKFDQEISFQDEAGQEVFRFQWGDLHPASAADPEGKKVYSAQTSVFPKGFSLSESDLSLLNLDSITNNKASVQ